jgi:hypothetical protein
MYIRRGKERIREVHIVGWERFGDLDFPKSFVFSSINEVS